MGKKRRTKIICTIGPACKDQETLFQLIKAGMDVARFNLSHGNRCEHEKWIKNLRLASERAQKRIGIMFDTRGPEIRLGTFRDGTAFLEKGSRFRLTEKPIIGSAREVSVSFSGFSRMVSVGDPVLLDDGNIQLEVTEIFDNQVMTKVLNSGSISDRKKVAVPKSQVGELPPLNDEDKKDLKFGVEQGIDFVAASFMRSGDDVLEVRRVLEELESSAQIIAKIESTHGVNSLKEILKLADGLMVARGDLGVEYPPEDIPILQKQMIVESNRLGKPVITATQMLESMMHNPRPTRAEASDVANAIFDGTDVVMLSGETASGEFPVEAVRFMSRIALRAEEVIEHHTFVSRVKSTTTNVTEAVSRSVVESALALNASAIVTPTESGYTARMVARFRPKMPVFAVTPHEHAQGWLSCVWGVEAVLGPKLTSSDDVSDMAMRVLREKGLIQDGALCVVTKGVPQGIVGTTNVMEVRTVGDIVIKGTGIGQVSVFGKAIVAVKGDEAVSKVHPGCVLVARSSDKSFIPALKKAVALILEEKGLTSDGAIAAIHLNIPAVIGAQDATKLIKDGDIITVDGALGVVYRGMARGT